MNLEWLTAEGNFQHTRVMMDVKKLDKEQIIDLFETVHKQYLIRGRMFSRLLKFVQSRGIILPPLDVLLSSNNFENHRESFENLFSQDNEQ